MERAFTMEVLRTHSSRYLNIGDGGEEVRLGNLQQGWEAGPHHTVALERAAFMPLKEALRHARRAATLRRSECIIMLRCAY